MIMSGRYNLRRRAVRSITPTTEEAIQNSNPSLATKKSTDKSRTRKLSKPKLHDQHLQPSDKEALSAPLPPPPPKRAGGAAASAAIHRMASKNLVDLAGSDTDILPGELERPRQVEGDTSSLFSIVNGSDEEDLEDAEEEFPVANAANRHHNQHHKENGSSSQTRRFAQSDRTDMVQFVYTEEGTDPKRGMTYQKKVHSLYSKFQDRSASPLRPHSGGSDSRHRVGMGIHSHLSDEDEDEEYLQGPSGTHEDSVKLIGVSSHSPGQYDDRKHEGGRQLNLISRRGRRESSTSSTASASDRETMSSIALQVFIPFLIAGFGMVGAGLVLDLVQHWDVFQEISEIFILVPALLGLKGNLEMTLASRLSTQANLGLLSTSAEQYHAASGNIALLQCQATVVGFIAALFAIFMDWLPEGQFNFSHAVLLCGSSLLTASVASFVLGIIMIAVVIASHKCNINPDNIATPIAASLGDLTTLYLLSKVSNMLYYSIDDSLWLCIIVIIAYLALIPFWAYVAHHNSFTHEVLYTGWVPVLIAMAISSFGGLILDFAVRRFKGIAVFQPVINGVGGNLVAVQASRLSTYLHQRAKLGQLPKSDRETCLNPCSTLFSSSVHGRTVRVLLLLTIPGHLIFTAAIQVLHGGHTSFTPTFLTVYCAAALLQVFLLLYIAHIMILSMWRRRVDPDNSAIPYLTALGDLLGGALLAFSFMFLFYIGDRDEDVGD